MVAQEACGGEEGGEGAVGCKEPNHLPQWEVSWERGQMDSKAEMQDGVQGMVNYNPPASHLCLWIVLLGHSHIISLHTVCGCFHTATTELRTCSGDQMVLKCSLFHSRKSLLTPWAANQCLQRFRDKHTKKQQQKYENWVAVFPNEPYRTIWYMK